MSDSTISLHVRLGKENYVVAAEEQDTLFDLKCRIFSLTELPPKQQRLIEAGRNLDGEDELDPAVTLKNLQIKDGSKIMAFKKDA